VSLEWTLAETVAAGETLTSGKVITLFTAINDRITSSPGAAAWRIFFSVFSMWREGILEMPGGQGSPMEDFLMSQGDPWPLGGLDEDGGPNTSSQVMAQVFGIGETVGDSQRINLVPLRPPPGPTPGGLLWKWILGVNQRGVFDPDTGARNAPAIDAAETAWQVDVQLGLPHGRPYGGYQPAPTVIDGVPCEPQEDGFVPLNELIFFTRIAPESAKGEVRTYAQGTCPENPNAVANVFELGRVYIVTFSDPHRPWDVLPRAEWIEGPYLGGGVLHKGHSGQTGRVRHWYMKEFVGSEGQRKEKGPGPKFDFPGGGWDPKKVGFDTAKFLTSQHGLSPNLGRLNGDGSLDILVPLFELTLDADGPDITAGTEMRLLNGFGADSATGHVYRAGFVLGGLYAQASGMKAGTAALVEVVAGLKVIDVLVLQADAEGRAEILRNYLQYPGVTAAPLKFRLATDLHFEATVTEAHPQLAIEASEILSYRPDREDQYVVMRLASAGSEPLAGKVFERARQVWEEYAASGMITNLEASEVREEIGAEGDGIAIASLSSFCEAARDFSQEMARLHGPDNLRAYAVENGVSVLYFKRHGGALNADLFAGMAPDLEEASRIFAGTEYIVRTLFGAAPSGTVTYHGANYAGGQRFIGVAGAETFSKSDGSNLVVMEWEGIKRPFTSEHKARGESREWVTLPEFKPYSVPGGTFDEIDFGRKTVLNNRCLFGSFEIGGDSHSALNIHLVFGVDHASVGPIGWEAPADYTYAEGTNHGFATEVRPTEEQRVAFYKSCPVFRTPYRMASVRSQWNAAYNDEEVRIEYTTRWQNVDAPAAIDRDRATWDWDNLINQGVATYGWATRTDENAVMEYLLKTVGDPSGYGQCRRRIGDVSNGQTIYLLYDNLWGSCVPHFLSVGLLPLPVEDGNEVQQPKTDTRATTKRFVQAEWYLWAMSGGFLDQEVSEQVACTLPLGRSGLIDFTYSNLIFRATGGQRRWISVVGNAERPDHPEGFGPGEVTPFRADVFNIYVAAVNLLNKARLMMPSIIQIRQHQTRVFSPTGVGFGRTDSCTLGAAVALVTDAVPAGAPEVGMGEWMDWNGPISADIGQALVACFDDGLGGDLQWGLLISGGWMEWRLQASDAAIWNMVPADVRELVDSGHVAVVGTLVETTSSSIAVQVSRDQAEGCQYPDNTPPGGAFGDLWDGTKGYRLVPNDQVVSNHCETIMAGGFNPNGTAPGGALMYIRKSDGATCEAGALRNATFYPNTELEPFVVVPLG
jgi:hypothetical protein